MNQKITFLQIVAKESPPTRRARICCSHLKEYKILDVAVQGIRRAESVARSKRYNEPTTCRVYGKKENHVNVILPILYWSDKDVADFIAERGIKCHPLYYDKNGKFNVRRRLGCIGCPLKNKRDRLKDYKQYPKLLKQLVLATDKWLKTHPNAESVKKFGNAYNLTYHNLFCKSYKDYLYKMQVNLWGEQLDCKKALEDYFFIKL